LPDDFFIVIDGEVCDDREHDDQCDYANTDHRTLIFLQVPHYLGELATILDILFDRRPLRP
jgi:hypothetical protein